MWWYEQTDSAIISKVLCIHIVKRCTPAPKIRVVLHPLSNYGKTTNEGCDLLRFAPFCQKCSTTGVKKLKNISPQNVPKHGIFGHFEKGINYD